jgi:hypothetical protein
MIAITNNIFCKKNLFLLFFGFIQLLFISWNMSCIATTNYKMMIIAAFLSNLLVCCSISYLAFGEWSNKIFYTIGCTGGCLLGTWISTLLR